MPLDKACSKLSAVVKNERAGSSRFSVLLLPKPLEHLRFVLRAGARRRCRETKKTDAESRFTKPLETVGASARDVLTHSGVILGRESLEQVEFVNLV
jgi:hypothetical protein